MFMANIFLKNHEKRQRTRVKWGRENERERPYLEHCHALYMNLINLLYFNNLHSFFTQLANWFAFIFILVFIFTLINVRPSRYAPAPGPVPLRGKWVLVCAFVHWTNFSYIAKSQKKQRTNYILRPRRRSWTHRPGENVIMPLKHQGE